MQLSARSKINNDPNALQVKALYDYVPDSSFEGKFLSFKSGDVITVTEKCEGGWYRGLLNNSEGLFPPTYCEELPPRRVMNVDTKKTSPTIKRMQTLLKLTVTGNGEKVEEVEQETQGGLVFTRERAQSDARVFASYNKDSSGMREVTRKIMEGKMLLEGKMGRVEEQEEEREDGVEASTQPIVARITEPAVKDKPTEVFDVSDLKRRVTELESQKTVMIEEFRSGKERLEEEFLERISLLSEMLDEKGLIIEILKKDLEIKAEENKEITIELELEIEKLRQNCVDLEQQVGHLTPLEGDILTPRDTRALPALPNHRNPPTPHIHASPSPSPTPSPISLSSSSSPPMLKRSASVPLSSSQELSKESPVTPTEPLKTPAKPVPSIAIHPSNLSASTAVPTPHHPPQRFNSLPTLSPLPKDLRVPISPRNASPRPHTPRTLNSPRVLYSSTLLETPPKFGRIPNFELSLAKLAELGPHPPSLTIEQPVQSDPALAAIEISDLKKRIAELETERLQMIEEYRNKKTASDYTSDASASTTTNPILASSLLGASTLIVPRATTPPLPPLPTLLIPITKSGSLPPVPFPPTSQFPPSTASPSPATSAPASISSLLSLPKPTQDEAPATSVRPRPTRSRNKDRKESSPSPSPNSSPNNTGSDRELTNKAHPRNLTWLQASVCVAVGSAAFYLVQSIVHRYYA